MAFHPTYLSYIEMESLWKEHSRNSDWQISLPKQLTDSFDFLVMKSWEFFFFSFSGGKNKSSLSMFKTFHVEVNFTGTWILLVWQFQAEEVLKV